MSISLENQPVYSPPITLTAPIKRAGGDINEVRVRKPSSGELRGLNLSGLMNCQADDMFKLLPRICEPNLIINEIEDLEPCDFIELSGAAVNFLLTPAQRKLLPKA